MGTLFDFYVSAAGVIDAACGHTYASRFVAFHSIAKRPLSLADIRLAQESLREIYQDDPADVPAEIEERILALELPDQSLPWKFRGAKDADCMRGILYAELLRDFFQAQASANGLLDLFLADCSAFCGLQVNDLPPAHYVESWRWMHDLLRHLLPQIPEKLRGEIQLRLLDVPPFDFSTKQELELALRARLDELLPQD